MMKLIEKNITKIYSLKVVLNDYNAYLGHALTFSNAFLPV